MKPRSQPLRRSPLSRVSKKRRKEMAVYSRQRKAFLEAHPWCQVWLSEHKADLKAILLNPDLAPRSCDIHHTRGRTGTNYLDESTWMAVSREAHIWIHDHPREARAKGYLY